MARFTDESVQAALNARMVTRNYAFPGMPDVMVACKLLSDAQLDGCRVRAADHHKKKGAEAALDPEFLDRCIHREVVAEAFFDCDNTEHSFFASAAEVAKIDSLTVRSLYEIYMMHASVMDPLVFASEEEVKGLAEQLGKSPRAAETLSLFDAPTLRILLLSTAATLRAMSQQPSACTGSS